MYKTITKELSKCELIDIMMGMDCEEDMCTYNIYPESSMSYTGVR